MHQAIFLTGSTGLVGRFVLAELLKRGKTVATLVRGQDAVQARGRVEQALQPFEKDGLLPRPRVIVGSLHEPQLGITRSEDIELLRRCELTVVNCAASIRFTKNESTEEPYCTNVEGSRKLLEFCRELQVCAFHHVSTAYVGSRSGAAVIKERPVHELSLGGNDYEKSKILAESMVLSQTYFPTVIHRPSIIVGDSKNFFTSTFHGFYAPLQIGAQFARINGFSKEAGDWFRQQLGLSPSDSKNLVPVDWVAACIAHIASAPTAINAGPVIYHWTNPQPVPCETMQSAIVTAIGERFAKPASRSQGLSKLPTPEDFSQQMHVYQSYFNSDPGFDTANSELLRASLPCPAVDLTMLTNMARYAMDSGFGWPRPALPELPFQKIIAALQGLPQGNPTDAACFIQLRLLGPGAIEPLYYAKQRNTWFVSKYPEEEDKSTIRCTGALTTLAACITGTNTLPNAIEKGYLTIEGYNLTSAATTMEGWLSQIVDPNRPMPLDP